MKQKQTPDRKYLISFKAEKIIYAGGVLLILALIYDFTKE